MKSENITQFNSAIANSPADETVRGYRRMVKQIQVLQEKVKIITKYVPNDKCKELAKELSDIHVIENVI